MKTGGFEINPVGAPPAPGTLDCSICGLYFGIRYSIQKDGQVRYFSLIMRNLNGKHICHMCVEQNPGLTKGQP